jgi:hypothetical protein
MISMYAFKAYGSLSIDLSCVKVFLYMFVILNWINEQFVDPLSINVSFLRALFKRGRRSSLLFEHIYKVGKMKFSVMKNAVSSLL